MAVTSTEFIHGRVRNGSRWISGNPGPSSLSARGEGGVELEGIEGEKGNPRILNPHPTPDPRSQKGFFFFPLPCTPARIEPSRGVPCKARKFFVRMGMATHYRVLPSSSGFVLEELAKRHLHGKVAMFVIVWGTRLHGGKGDVPQFLVCGRASSVPQVLETPRVGGRSKLFLQTDAVYFQSIEEHPKREMENRTRLFSQPIRERSRGVAGLGIRMGGY
ncbi:hypothetical protein CDAR_62501 [Caerostris darwini]|uniref:Uncharacterized protein n=1 Tax=Caerostris darwini TaxID=1538125 RepID=A0AAV4UFR5_9ARAC|nr:hypothetical protein CDAR_62501 [Caerostris darwini]